MRNCQTHFTFPPTVYEDAISPRQHLLLSFFIMAILVGITWYLTVVLIWTSLISCAYWPFIYIYIFFFWEMSAQILHPFLNGLLIFLLLNCIYTLDTSPLSDFWFANIFSHSLGYLFTFLIVFLILTKSSLSVWSFLAYTFRVVSKKSLLNSRFWKFMSLFPSKSFNSFCFLCLDIVSMLS